MLRILFFLCAALLPVYSQIGTSGGSKGGGSTTWSTQGVSFTAVLSGGYKISTAAVVATLPIGTTTGQTISFVNASGGNFTIVPAATQKVMGDTAGVLVNIPATGFTLVFFADTGDWRMI